jgi:MFS family permease
LTSQRLDDSLNGHPASAADQIRRLLFPAMTTPQHHEKELESGEELGLAQSDKSAEATNLQGLSNDTEKDGNTARLALQKTKSHVDVPPNGGYGWVCVAACATINAHTWGLNSSYAVFLAYYLSNNVFSGATPLHYAFIGGLSISQALIISPLATLTTRLFSTRTTLLIGVVLETASFIGASFATRIWHLFLTQGLCFGWGMGFLFVGSVGIAAQWFTTRRSLANGIAAAGSGIGGLVYSLAAQAMIKDIGLPWAFRILGIIAFVVNTSCALLIRDRNKQIGSSLLSFDWRLFKKPEFVGLMVFGFLSMLGYVVLLFSLPNYARTVGLTAKQGSIIGALLNLGQSLGRPPIGYFSDSIGRLNMATSMTFLCGLFCLVIWMFAKSFGVIIFFAMIGGTVAGTYWAVAAPVTAEVMGLKRLPSALSITWLVLVLPTTCESCSTASILLLLIECSFRSDWPRNRGVQWKLYRRDHLHWLHVHWSCGVFVVGTDVEDWRAGETSCY